MLYIYKEYEMMKLVIKDNKITDSNMNFNPSNLFFPDENSNTSNIIKNFYINTKIRKNSINKENKSHNHRYDFNY